MRPMILSALAMLAAVSVTACNRHDQNASNNPNSPTTTSQAPSTTPPAGTPSTAPTDQTGSATTAPGSTSSAAVDDATVTAKVKAALAAADGISGTNITVETQQGTVILTGKVADATQSQRAAQVAGGVEGVRSVDNRLQTSS